MTILSACASAIHKDAAANRRNFAETLRIVRGARQVGGGGDDMEGGGTGGESRDRPDVPGVPGASSARFNATASGPHSAGQPPRSGGRSGFVGGGAGGVPPGMGGPAGGEAGGDGRDDGGPDDGRDDDDDDRYSNLSPATPSIPALRSHAIAAIQVYRWARSATSAIPPSVWAAESLPVTDPRRAAAVATIDASCASCERAARELTEAITAYCDARDRAAGECSVRPMMAWGGRLWVAQPGGVVGVRVPEWLAGEMAAAGIGGRA